LKKVLATLLGFFGTLTIIRRPGILPPLPPRRYAPASMMTKYIASWCKTVKKGDNSWTEFQLFSYTLCGGSRAAAANLLYRLVTG